MLQRAVVALSLLLDLLALLPLLDVANWGIGFVLDLQMLPQRNAHVYRIHLRVKRRGSGSTLKRRGRGSGPAKYST
jgi:hypothetical protein